MTLKNNASSLKTQAGISPNVRNEALVPKPSARLVRKRIILVYKQTFKKDIQMNIKHTLTTITKLGIGMTAIVLLLAACSGGGSSSSSGSNGTVTGVATPSKVSVVNTN